MQEEKKEQQPSIHLIDGQLLMGVLNYLAKQPYADVTAFMSALQQLPLLEGDILKQVQESFNNK